MRPRTAASSIQKILFTITLSLILGACRSASEPAPVHFGSGPRRILFVGNSLTGQNDLAAMVVAIAESAKVSPLPSADVDWESNYALVDHWNDGRVQRLIAIGHYDLVVLQQGPSSVEANRDSLRLVSKLFATPIRATGALPGLFSVWPTADRPQDFDRATESYRLAANDVGAMLFPGGEVWRAAWRRDASLQLYSGDGLHPSALGSYAVALSMVALMYDRTAVGLVSTFRTSTGQIIAVDAGVARTLQLAADEANQRFGSTGRR